MTDEYSIDTPPTLVDQTMSPAIGQLAAALSKAQGEITGALKDSTNPFFKSTYADLSAVLSAGREALSKNDLAVIQTTEPSDAGIVVITTLAHKSGEWIRGKLCMTPVKNDPQGIGSCITYARRYALSAIVGIAQVDDDGNTASGKDKKPITDDQARELEARITDNDINMEAVKKWMRASLKVEHFADLNEAGYKAVMHKVDATIKAKK